MNTQDGVSELRRSYKYQRWLQQVNGSSCVLCHQSYSNTQSPRLEIHHIWAFAQYPNKRWDTDNAMTLCHDCHLLVHKLQKAGLLSELELDTLRIEYKTTITELVYRLLAEKYA